MGGAVKEGPDLNTQLRFCVFLENCGGMGQEGLDQGHPQTEEDAEKQSSSVRDFRQERRGQRDRKQ